MAYTAKGIDQHLAPLQNQALTGGDVMELGMIGLGRMGFNMTERLMLGGHKLVVYDRNAGTVQSAVDKGAKGTASLKEVVEALTAPRVVWIMVPSGAPVDATIDELLPLMAND